MSFRGLIWRSFLWGFYGAVLGVLGAVVTFVTRNNLRG